ncbi:VP13A protein, partial [Amia calva]|nr:VP13A protein [Amia calva]
MSSSVFLKEICLKCPEYMDKEDKPVHLITTLDNTEDDLLTLEYIKADKNGPEFRSTYKNTEQLIKVNFSSLDVHLHIEALLNAMNFLNNLVPSSEKKDSLEEQTPAVGEEKKDDSALVKKLTPKKSKFEDVINLHVRADLTCLKVFIRGQKGQISEISIEGLDSEVIMRKKTVEVLAKLRNIVILDCDKDALYKKAVSIAGKEVFSFRMVSHVDATEGDAYTDMNIVDSCVTLTVGCIQVIFVNKFVSSILDFINNFQTAKEALTEVTVQAAEKAATGVLDFAERSSRMSLDIHVKAPVVFVPQSSVSRNVIVADFGLVTVKNHFSVVESKAHVKIPPIVDIMKVGLSDLKLYRTVYEDNKFQSEIQLLKPVNLDLVIERNLSASWFHNIPDIKIKAHLKPMNLVLSQEDLTVVLRTLSENLSETSDASAPPASVDKSDTVSTKDSQMSQNSGGNTVVTAAVVEMQQTTKLKTTLKLDFQFDSLTLVLYSSSVNEAQILDSRDELLKLAEFKLGLISTAVQMYSDSSMKAAVKLANCLLDDKRQSVKKITPRMVEMKPGTEKNVMVEVNYKQGREGTVLDTIVHDIYLCASVEFLLTVADIFVKASQQGFSAPQKNTKQVTTSSKEPVPTQPVTKTEMNVLVKNPEIVFVADLTRADAPALVMTTQCEVCMKSDPDSQKMTAAIKDLKIVACPFLREMRKNNITTVLQPCEVFFQSVQLASMPQSIELSIKSLALKVSPIIINTVITITSALSPAAETPQELESPVPPNLWDKKDCKELKLWFLEEENEDDSLSVTPLVPKGESLQMSISSIFLTLEAGVGHRTVPMLLAKSSFQGSVKNWSTLINLQSHLNLEVHYYNEVLGVWEPLLEPLEEESSDGFRPWTLGIKMKKKPVKYTAVCDEVDYNVPDYKTVININSKDQLNITLSKCGLAMLSNLGTAFAEAASQTAECFQKDQAPFVIKNGLGLPMTVAYSEIFSVVENDLHNKSFELQDGQTLNMDYVRTMSEQDQFTAMTNLSEKNYYIQTTPTGHSATIRIPLIKVGRGLYSVLHKDSGVTRFIVCQIYSVEGSKVITIRSPFQMRNHFSIPLKVYEGDVLLGTALPQEEFCIPLDSYRSILSLQPVTEGDETYAKSEGFSYESITQQSGKCVQQKCHHPGLGDQVMIINMVPVQDTLTSNGTEEKFDVPFILHFLSDLAVAFVEYQLVQLMVSDSDLSDEFSLDTVGSHGDVKCKGRSKDYLVGVKIDASSFSLTRIVTFVPFYMLVNRTKHHIQIREEHNQKWTEADPNQSAVPFWPEKDSKKLIIKIEGSDSQPQTIDFHKQENCLLLHLDNKVGGVIVDVNLTEHSTTIRFSDYHDGAAPFLIINHTKDEVLEFYQSTQVERDKLEPSKAVYYTWAEPSGSRILKWKCGKYTGELKNEEDKLLDVEGKGELFLISFYEGLQRVALFTEEKRIYKLLCESEKAELAEQEIILSLQNMGISLVNNGTKQEVSFIGITSSDIVWELKPKKKSRWKPMSIKQTDLLEKAFREYIDNGPIDHLIANLDSNFQVCFTPNGADMKILQPNEAPIRRNFLPAVKVEYSVSARQKSYRIQINRIQIQNQLPGAIFPFVFYPIKPPKSVTMDSEPKPLTDVSIVTRSAGHSDISRIKYFKVLIQEMDCKLDLGFLYAILDLFTQENAKEVSSEQEVELFNKDIEYIKTELNNASATDTSAISLFEYFHISPIKLHLSFSLSSGGEDGNKEKRETEMIPVQSLNLLLKSIGATLTDAQDIVFKLAYFELNFQFCTTQQLQWEVVRHYSKQAIKQMYVLVLGLDVLGNPFGLIRDLSEGVEAFFYEPYQGAIQGPEEFVEGMALGVKALVGGAVGGIAGAASRITGAMAKGMAAMTLDEEYQQKRREQMNKEPSGLREGITRGGKGLVSGFVSGITGIVTKPIKGAQKEGAAGFFKGIGKGIVGAVTRPTGGIIDMASSTFQGIKRYGEMSSPWSLSYLAYRNEVDDYIGFIR